MRGIMPKTIKEFQDDLRVIREEMYQHGETADAELIASWLDRLVMSLDKLSESLDMMAVEVDLMSKCCGSASSGKMKAAKKTAKKKVMKKAAKKKVMKKAPKKKAAKKSCKLRLKRSPKKVTARRASTPSSRRPALPRAHSTSISTARNSCFSICSRTFWPGSSRR